MGRTAWALPTPRRSKNSLKTLSYNDFLGIVAGGKKDVNAAQDLVMPSFGLNKNVMCYIDDIYVYLRARANDAVGRERPAKHERSRPRPRNGKIRAWAEPIEERPNQQTGHWKGRTR